MHGSLNAQPTLAYFGFVLSCGCQIFKCICVCVCVCVCMCMFVYVFVCMCVCMGVYVCVWVCVWVCMCVYVCVCMCVSVCMGMCVHIFKKRFINPECHHAEYCYAENNFLSLIMLILGFALES